MVEQPTFSKLRSYNTGRGIAVMLHLNAILLQLNLLLAMGSTIIRTSVINVHEAITN